jgi:hypothetical protein
MRSDFFATVFSQARTASWGTRRCGAFSGRGGVSHFASLLLVHSAREVPRAGPWTRRFHPAAAPGRLHMGPAGGPARFPLPCRGARSLPLRRSPRAAQGPAKGIAHCRSDKGASQNLHKGPPPPSPGRSPLGCGKIATAVFGARRRRREGNGSRRSDPRRATGEASEGKRKVRLILVAGAATTLSERGRVARASLRHAQDRPCPRETGGHGGPPHRTLCFARDKTHETRLRDVAVALGGSGPDVTTPAVSC